MERVYRTYGKVTTIVLGLLRHDGSIQLHSTSVSPGESPLQMPTSVDYHDAQGQLLYEVTGNPHESPFFLWRKTLVTNWHTHGSREPFVGTEAQMELLWGEVERVREALQQRGQGSEPGV